MLRDQIHMRGLIKLTDESLVMEVRKERERVATPGLAVHSHKRRVRNAQYTRGYAQYPAAFSLLDLN